MTTKKIKIHLKDRASISIVGGDAKNFLQAIITNDIRKADNGAIYSCILTPQGKFLYDFFIMKNHTDNLGYLIDCCAEYRQDLIEMFNKYKLRSNVIIEAQDYKIYSLMGGSDLLHLENTIVFNDPRSLLMGKRIFIKTENILEENILDDFVNAEYHYYDYIRINNVIPEGYKDLIREKSFPLEFGLEKINAIDFEKGCYIGQEVITRTWRRGVIRKHIYKVTSENILPKSGTDIIINESKIGIMCSSIDDIGLALIYIEEYNKYSEHEIRII